MRSHRLLSVLFALSATAFACEPPSDATSDTTSEPTEAVRSALSIKKSYTRQIFVHMMPWFEVGGLHWSMNHRNPATGVA
ncbi:MAG TPA: hypothetical protein VLA14_00550, partial [Polyangia bacterium]|nr:hypothetical protein [Polyangia bacterium]